jgi:hypothetical protein
MLPLEALAPLLRDVLAVRDALAERSFAASATVGSA